MKRPVSTSPTSPRLWFAVFGAPVAWGLQYVIGYWSSEQSCGTSGSGDTSNAATIVVAVIALIVVVAAIATAIQLKRATDELELEPAAGRIHFLAVIGITIAPLFAAMIVFNLTGVLVLESCHQS